MIYDMRDNVFYKLLLKVVSTITLASLTKYMEKQGWGKSKKESRWIYFVRSDGKMCSPDDCTWFKVSSPISDYPVCMLRIAKSLSEFTEQSLLDVIYGMKYSDLSKEELKTKAITEFNELINKEFKEMFGDEFSNAFFSQKL